MYALIICRTHPFLILYKGLEHDLKVSWNGNDHTASAYSGNQGYQNNLTKTRMLLLVNIVIPCPCVTMAVDSMMIIVTYMMITMTNVVMTVI